MKHFRIALTLILALGLLALPVLTTPAGAQDPQTQTQATALMRGYRTGYSDGYQAGLQDVTYKTARDFQSKLEYQRADRAYASTYGKLEEYRDGYRQGFEVGYAAGYERRPFDSSIPADLQLRGDDTSGTANGPVDPNNNSTRTSTSGSLNAIPRDTILRVELLNNLSTDASQKGDRFQVRVVEPKEYEGATIEGQVMRVKRPGRVKSTAQLQLSFDEIRFSDGRSAKMSAQVIEVLSTGGSQGVGKVDSEGGVQGRNSTKGDMQKVGAAAGIGAVIGAIAGGGVGAAVGATIGAGVGTAGVLSERGRDVRLYQGQQMRIRTAGDASIQ